MKNYYAILEVPKNATRNEIKQSYIDHICFIRPDRFEKDTPEWESATKVLCDINEAFACLGDPERRREYDIALSRPDAGGDNAAPRRMPARVLTFAVTAALLLFAAFFVFTRGDSSESGHEIAAAAGETPAEERGAGQEQPENRTGAPPAQDEDAVLAGISKERPSNRATSANAYEYLQLTSDEYYEILLEADSTEIYDDGNIAAVWTKHIQNGERRNPASQDAQTDANGSNIGWFITLNAYNLSKDTVAMLKIMYYDKNGVFIGGSDVPAKKIRWTPVREGSPRVTLTWIKSAVKATEKVSGQHKRARQIARRIQAARDRLLEAEYSQADKKIRNFDVKKGGTITAESAFCRRIPTPDAPVIRGSLSKDTPVFVTKQYRDEKGMVWFFVEHIKTKGWLADRNVKVY